MIQPENSSVSFMRGYAQSGCVVETGPGSDRRSDEGRPIRGSAVSGQGPQQLDLRQPQLREHEQDGSAQVRHRPS